MKAVNEVSLSEYRQLQVKATTEPELQAMVIEEALARRWLVSWIPDWMYKLAIREMKRNPRRGYQWSPPGNPDLMLARDGRLILAELKTEEGRLRPPQREWADTLAGIGGPVEVYLWRPRDWYTDRIKQILA